MCSSTLHCGLEHGFSLFPNRSGARYLSLSVVQILLFPKMLAVPVLGQI